MGFLEAQLPSGRGRGLRTQYTVADHHDPARGEQIGPHGDGVVERSYHMGTAHPALGGQGPRGDAGRDDDGVRGERAPGRCGDLASGAVETDRGVTEHELGFQSRQCLCGAQPRARCGSQAPLSTCFDKGGRS